MDPSVAGNALEKLIVMGRGAAREDKLFAKYRLQR